MFLDASIHRSGDLKEFGRREEKVRTKNRLPIAHSRRSRGADVGARRFTASR
jgi:hypothetical protein